MKTKKNTKYKRKCLIFNGKRNKGGELPQKCDRKEQPQDMQGKRKMRADKKSTKHGRWTAAPESRARILFGRKGRRKGGRKPPAAPGADVGIQSRRNERRKEGAQGMMPVSDAD